MFNIGDRVKLVNSSISGIVTRKIDKNNKYYVNINNKTIEVNGERLEITPHINTRKNINIEFNVSKNNCSEIMLRHQDVQTAILNLDKFIDTAILSGVKRVKIIHGRSGGVLRKCVHEYLKDCPYVKEYRIGDYFEGSIGVTIAWLK